MSVHLQRSVERLKKALLSLCALVEEQAQAAVKAMLDRDENAARVVVHRDLEVDQREVEIEEECLKVLALHQPVAFDLRFIVAVLKMNNDLERIGDLAVNIARKAIAFGQQPMSTIPFDLEGMWHETQGMLREALDALVNLDPKLAQGVCARDSQVDRMKRKIRGKAEELIQAEPSRAAAILSLLAVARNLERMADHATNIAEDVIYMVDGRIARHGEGASAATTTPA